MSLPPPLGPSPDQGAGSPTPVAPPGMNGIPGAQGMPSPPYPQPPNPANMQYGTTTQQDGTVLIYMMNPDGSPGPVIHVFKPPHLKGGSGHK